MNPEQLTEIVSQALDEERSDWKRNGKIYPSGLGGEGCPLEFWRKVRDYPTKDLSPGQLLMFRQGDSLEDQFVALLEGTDMGEWVVVDTQTSVEFGGLTGRLDVLLRHLGTGEMLVVEVKTKRGGAFRYMDVEGPKPNNVLQCQFYMAGVGADRGLIVYIDREGQNFLRVFSVKRDDEAVRGAIRDMKARAMGPEPEGMKLRLKHNHNKKDDSLALQLPWQVEWCQQKDCPCKKALGDPPKGVLARVKSDGTVYPTKEAGRRWLPIIEDLLHQEGG